MADSGPIELVPLFEREKDASIIEKCVREISRAFEGDVRVAPLGRSGFSGARLYKCVLAGGRVFVVKIDEVDKITVEARAIDRIQPYFHVHLINRDPVVHDSDGALIYPFAGGGNLRAATQVFELNDIAFNMDSPEDKVEAAVTAVYEMLGECEVAKSKQTTFQEEYNRYLRKRRGTETLKSMLGSKFEEGRYEYLGADCVNPDRFIDDDRFKHTVELTCGPIHGDFHPKNVMVDNRGHTHVIDFAWADTCAHRLKDYVLMECSLRFNVFPHRIDLGLQKTVDEALLSFDGVDAIPSITDGSSLHKAYERLAKLLKRIRVAAQPLLANTSTGFHEYLAAQTLVLHGLLQYPDYHNPAAVRALGMIAAFLDKQWKPHGVKPC